MAGVVICTTFAVAALGVEQNSVWGGAGRTDGAESLWIAAGWLTAVLVGGTAVHVAIRRWAPSSNEIIFGLTELLMGIGWVFVARVDASLASEQAVAVLLGFAAIAATLVAAPRLDWLLKRPGVCGFIAVALLAAGSFSGGTDPSAGAYEPPRQWLNLGSLSVQPYGLAKLAVILAACALTVCAPRWLPVRVVPHRHTAGAIVAAVGAWTLLIAGGDIASSVVIFVAAWLPLWLDGDDHLETELPTVARTARTRALGGIAASYGIGVVVLASVYDWLSAQLRHWQDPWTATGGAATVESAFAISAGGLSGVGPGLGAPDRIAGAHSDFVFAVITEELGILGGAAILAALMLFVGVGAGIAQRAYGTHRLLAATATVVVGLQAFLTIAGVLRLLPHTVGALPFVAHGPAAMVGNCIAVGMLLAISSVSDVSRGEPQQLAQGDS